MSYIRILHKTWNVFWTFIGVLVLTVALLFGATLGLMQLQPVKDQFAIELQNRFNNHYEGVLSLGQIDGFIPINMGVKDIRIYPDSSSYDPVFEATEIRAGVDIWSLFQNRLIVNSLEVQSPNTIFDADNDFSLERAFQPRQSQNDSVQTSNSLLGINNDKNFQIIVPSVKITDGRLLLRHIMNEGNAFSKSDSLIVNNLNVGMFFEFTNEQRFLDIDYLSFNTPELNLPEINLYGQIFNDERFFELNAINLKVGNSSFRFGAEAEGVNFLKANVAQQLSNASFNIVMESFSLQPELLVRYVNNAPEFSSNLVGNWLAEGSLDSLNIGDSEFFIGESGLNFSGKLLNLKNPDDLSYQVDIQSLIAGRNELVSIFEGSLNTAQAEALVSSRVEGEIKGTRERIDSYLKMLGPRGSLKINGGFDIYNPHHAFDYSFQTDSLDLGGIINPNIVSTDLDISGEIKSSSTNIAESEGGLIISSGQGTVDGRVFSQASVLANWKDGMIEPDLRLAINGSNISAVGQINLKSDVPVINLTGKATQLPVKQLLANDKLRDIIADVEYAVNIHATNPDEIYGQVSLDVLQAVAGEDSLDRHQLYFDFNEPSQQRRILRFTSTAFDATIEGNYQPSDLYNLSSQWQNYFKRQFTEEILFDSVKAFDQQELIIQNQNLEITGRLKNVGLIKAYIPTFPSVNTQARLNATLNVNSERMLFNSSISDNRTIIDGFEADSALIQVTGSFRSDANFRDFSGLQLQMTTNKFSYEELSGSGAEMEFNFNQDSLIFRQSIQTLANDARFNFESSGMLKQGSIEMNIEDFYLGSEAYQWENSGVARIALQSNDRLVLDNFRFESGEQFIDVNGTYSTSLTDSVNYRFGDVDLNRISQLIGGRITFGGLLDGAFTTKSLTSVPTIFGNLNVEAFQLNNQIAGDVNISSRYNAEEDLFDTNISVRTDSSKYPEYYDNTDYEGQFFDINGYILAPKDGNFPEADSLFRFNADFKNIDLWILPIIGPKVFAESSGRAKGKGVIWGNLNTYDFEADFDVGTEDAAYLRPQFLDTYYYAQGGIRFTRHDGFIFNEIFLIDPSGGTAILDGYYDLNDFGPTDSMRISLDMDEFQFLNSTFDPSAAFYGTAYGSSTVVISGTNLDPVLRTESPIVVTDFSEISIPLLEETEFNEDNRFIRFVNSFDQANLNNSPRSTTPQGLNDNSNTQEQEQLTFAERFTLDLQFVAEDPMTVRLIFDPVTGDVVTAEGTGRIRILLEDEQVSMFGRFDINGGRYQFVSGDIFTRRFELESGGTIIWEGDPANARLNLNTVYSARPDINTLSNTSRDPDNIVRVPVDLVLNIGGTISSIENDFFFRLPDNFESQQNSTLSTQLAAINRDEELKLIQAANFMLMGDFIPVSSAGETQGSFFGDNLSGSAAVLNPLLSSQVINPLLSNQINSLLNSDLSSLDVDFNLNTYNQVDLGVALRLYNDKLILRREGQITGRQSNIGDLGATYQINRTFAVTAFHRQDLSFGTVSSTEQSQQSQDINGVGVEAKLTFNTWNEFFDRLFSPFRRLFGGNNEEEQSQQELTENTRVDNPL